mmetsp:Transcript_60107/g.106394  ORF Transcript_60107/g.106394 Transcript_60107/m.106394 type:complete len:90 (-) Transcript_60107:460-729(-)
MTTAGTTTTVVIATTIGVIHIVGTIMTVATIAAATTAAETIDTSHVRRSLQCSTAPACLKRKQSLLDVLSLVRTPSEKEITPKGARRAP